MTKELLKIQGIELLKKLISTPSFSEKEDKTANIIGQWFDEYDIKYNRIYNNLIAYNKNFDKSKKTILLNSHHDTVLPNAAYTKDPFNPEIIDGKLYGLGSNDAGGALVSLIAAFTYFYTKENLNYNLVIAPVGEEESPGDHGIGYILKDLPEIDCAIVGEPTEMQMAISEKGLLVLDCVATGTPGHVAHHKSDNSIYKAIQDIDWIKNYKFPKVSKTLGEVKMTVSQIKAGSLHNVVPAKCEFVVDIRITDAYTNEEILDTIKKNINSDFNPRNLLLKPSSISIDHQIVQSGLKLGRETYGSPTLSDQAYLSCPSLKMGPGDSKRSHSADEFIFIHEVEEAIDIYIDLLSNIL